MRALVSAALRAATLGSRFALMFCLAWFLEPVELGLFGLFLATVGFSVMVVGVDFYTFSQREILAADAENKGGIMLRQGVFYLVLYAFALPSLGVVFLFDLLPERFFYWFFGLLIIEHLAQEINRLLVALHRPLFAGSVLFVRQGSWVWVALSLMAINPDNRSLETVLTVWAVGGFLACALGAYGLVSQTVSWRVQSWSVDWFLKGLRTGAVFLAATLSLKAMLTVDRYLVDAFAGPEVLGAYTLYAGMAFALFGFLDAGVLVFLYPRVVEGYRKGDFGQLREASAKLAVYTVLVAMLLVGAAALAAPPVLHLIGKPVYLEHLDAFWWLLVGIFFYAIGMIPHYPLYAFGRDRLLLGAHVSALAVFFGVAVVLSDSWPTLAAPVAVAVGFAWMCLYKTVACIGEWRIRVGPLLSGPLERIG